MIKDYNRNLKLEINERIKSTYDINTGTFTVAPIDAERIKEICYINDVGLEDQ